MNIPLKILYAGIFAPLLLYISLVSNILYTVFTGVKAPAPDITWSKSVSVDRRKDLVLKRSEPLFAYKQCVSGKGEWYHLEHFTEDVIYRDPMFSSEGRQDLSAVFTLARNMLEDLVFDVISVTQDEVQMSLVMELHVTPVILPGFSFPMTTHLYFDEAADGSQKIFKPGLGEFKLTRIITMMIFRIREEWNGVPLPRTWLHAWLGRVHTVMARTLSQYM